MDHFQSKKAVLPTFILLFVLLIPSMPLFGQDSIFKGRKILHSVYITANTGSSTNTDILEAIAQSAKGEKPVSLLLTGNITGPKGFPYKPSEREKVKDFLRNDLLFPLKDFSGKIYFTPGVHEWNTDAPESIDDLETFLQDNINSEFWPGDGCPIDREAINDQVELLIIDSQWFLEDWDDHPTMNANCDYKTRAEFFKEFKDDLKDSQGKIVLVAIHHPVMSNNRIPFLRKITGASPDHFESNQQKELRGKLETLASQYDDVIFVSGNHKNLQFLHNGRNPQIISGAAATTQYASVKKDGLFASTERGYAKLSIFEDQSSAIQFFEVKEGQSKLVFAHTIPRERITVKNLETDFPDEINQTEIASIYSPIETSKSKFYKWLWGDRFRKIYSQQIDARTLIIDSLPGNPKIIGEGGGQQSRSLRLINDSNNEYTLRALRKDPIRYLQADVIQTNFVGDFLENTIAQRFVSDYFTTAHPYAPFAVNGLSSSLHILHANPKIYYVPKQKGLGIYNQDYGNALFMLEEHAGEENKGLKTFGSPDNIISTADLLLEMRESKNSYVDQDAYLRARIFDMLIGDWDRHQDQWRWARFIENGKFRYEPIPRDRDHVFSKYDGVLLPVIKSVVPLLRKMQDFDDDIKSVKWFNWSGYPLDQRFITTDKWEDWKTQVEYIQNNLTDEAIEKAFDELPKEIITNSEISDIKETLKARRENLPEFTRRYFNYLKRFQTVTGTQANDHFLISRNDNGNTDIKILNNGREVFSKTYSSQETSEIWIYGLEGEDTFEITGAGKDLIKLKVIGGSESDVYDFKNPRKAKLYDHKSTGSIIKNKASHKWLVNSYDINQFHYTKRKYGENRLLPVVDYVTDAGFTLGIKDIYTKYGLANNPFSSQYTLSAQYFLASNGFELNTSAEFAHIFYNWNLKLEGRYSSPNYFINYFGTGNTTEYDKNEVTKKYNRVKLEQVHFHPSLVRRSESGSFISVGPQIETVRVGYSEETFLADNFSPEDDIFDRQFYAGAEAEYSFENKNNPSYPSLGSRLDIIAGYKQNIDEHNNQFGYVEPSFSIDYPLISSGFAVFATKLGGTALIGDDYEFYHAATLGGNRSLRGYRNHRFNGKYSFYHSTDLRTALGLIRTDFVPLIVGVSAGFDYGRVWTEDDNSGKWHNNYGGSFWVNGFFALTTNFGFYHGGDGNRFTFTVNFKY